jgi:hypothetical protein
MFCESSRVPTTMLNGEGAMKDALSGIVGARSRRRIM